MSKHSGFKLDAKMIVILAAVAIVVIVALIAWSSYNSLIVKDQEVEKAEGNIQTQYQRRFDLIPNLVNVVQSYAGFEKSTLTEITQLRSQWQTAPSFAARAQTANQFESVLSRLLLVSENYPQLRASEQFTGLQDSLSETENMVSVARTRYNDAVRDYNVAVKTFPSAIFAGMFGFSERDYFEVLNEATETAPKVDIQIPE